MFMPIIIIEQLFLDDNFTNNYIYVYKTISKFLNDNDLILLVKRLLVYSLYLMEKIIQ